ncbi:MAG: trypsin-like serine protease [Erythrobacter sp.]|nr:trypsin-like serine protease [Erythrobacter sp.]
MWRPERLRGVRCTIDAKSRLLCGGTWIARGWFPTAVHCLRDQERTIAGCGYEVRLGVFNPREDEGLSYPITGVHIHESYDPSTFAFDNALVQYNRASRTQRVGDEFRCLDQNG